MSVKLNESRCVELHTVDECVTTVRGTVEYKVQVRSGTYSLCTRVAEVTY